MKTIPVAAFNKPPMIVNYLVIVLFEITNVVCANLRVPKKNCVDYLHNLKVASFTLK
jgi:hypothetical protein